MYIISACLLGENCKYNGGNNETQWVKAFSNTHSFFPVCPERQGGLPIPRCPAEITGDKVRSSAGDDWTQAFVRGAEGCYQEAKEEAARRKETIEGAILKARSPSCGCGQIYDGTFSRKLISGDGYLTRLLKKEKIEVITEKENGNDDQL